MKEVISIQVFFTLILSVIFQILITSGNCPAKPLQKIEIKVNCYIVNSRNPVLCSDSIQVDTKANITCKYGYQNSKNIKIQEITCQSNSQWSEEPMACEDVCVDNPGVVSKTFDNIIEYKLSKTPWHVSILVGKKTMCYGVILNAKTVLTTHACIMSFSKYDMTVVAAKTSRPPELEIDENYSKRSGVNQIYINYKFSNYATRFSNTKLAILELLQPLEYSKFIRSACIDWSAIISDNEYYVSKPVFTTNWDAVEANCDYNETISDELITKKLPDSKNVRRCDSFIPFDTHCDEFQSFENEFCPLRGAGVMLQRDGSTRTLLWALVLDNFKISPTKFETMDSHGAVFIKILHQRDFIMEYMEKFKPPKVVSYQSTINACPTVNFNLKHLIAACKFEDKTVSCNDNLKPGTTVNIQCEQDYQKPIGNKPDEIKCLEEGIWSDEFYQCEPLCGKLEKYSNDKAVLKPLIREGLKIQAISVPWQVAIFANNTSLYRGKWKLICGGTLTHKNIVISAAHCFWDYSNNAALHPSSFLVASGKRYGTYEATEPYEQYSRITEISIPTTFDTNTLVSDIAVLVLEKKFTFNSHTKPACLAWSLYGNYDYSSDITGLVSGWGSTTEFSTQTSNELRMIKIPTIDASSCRHIVDPEYKDFITGGKFCAQGSHGETACSGDSGGGFLTSKIDEDGIEQYYLIGIVSSGVNPAKHCTENVVSVYTNIQYHQDIIKVTAENNTQS